MRAEILLAQAGRIPGWIGRGGMLDRVNGAEVMDLECKEVSASASADGKPSQQAQVCVRVDANIVDVRVEVRLGQVGVTGGRLDPLLKRGDDVVSSEIAELDLLRLIEPAGRQPSEPTGAKRDFRDVVINEVAALTVRILQRLLHVQQKPGEILSNPQGSEDSEDLVAEGDWACPGFERSRQGVSGRVFALERVIGVKEAHPPGAIIVIAKHARSVEAGRVGLGGDSVEVRPGASLVLGDD